MNLLKSTIFWDITPCTPLKVNRCFGETYCFHLQGRKISRARNQLESRWQADLHDVISQKTVLFLTTAVRTSNPTYVSSHYTISSFLFLSGLYVHIITLFLNTLDVPLLL
jgi:hypothetical protein